MVQTLIAGNWKMNGTRADLAVIDDIAAAVADRTDVATMICPPALLVAAACQAASQSRLEVGGQDCSHRTCGAHTGDLAADQLADAGATAVIVGHSERRSDHREASQFVRAKAEAAIAAGLTAIVCVGETAGERAIGRTNSVVLRQLDDSLPETTDARTVVVAYEPVWAIGTGLVATPDDVAAVHAAMRNRLTQRYGAAGHSIRLLYGGSVKPDNAATLLAIDHVNGALVGGASLKAADFLGIVNAAQAARIA